MDTRPEPWVDTLSLALGLHHSVDKTRVDTYEQARMADAVFRWT